MTPGVSALLPFELLQAPLPWRVHSDEALVPLFTQDCPRIFSAGLDLKELCGKNPAHYTEYYKALQNLWLRLYLSNLVLISAINVSVHTPESPC